MAAFDPRHKSRVLLDGPDRAAARSYFRAVGFTDEDLARPLVGIAHCWIELTPCNSNHRKLAQKVARFRQVNMDNPNTHHDALEFPNGQIVLLHRLCEGQHATVLQLPVAPRVSGAEAQKHRAVA